MTSTSLPHEWIPAINFNERRDGQVPEILLLHYTGTPTAQYAIDLLTTDAGQVSCHYLVHEDGRIVHMVDEDMRAWHAGASSWDGREDVNSRSIGIEIVNPGHGPDYRDFPDAQIEAVIALSRDIISRHAIQPRHVLAHSDVAPGRKVDPGEKFPWGLLAGHGVGLWVDDLAPLAGEVLQEGDCGEHVERLRRNLRVFGYSIGQGDQFDGWTQTVVRTFQMHYRPSCCDGVADAETRSVLTALLTSHAS
jgi:N-acetylmuramoyl-L-alanine amidase